jgi:6-phosphogluconolactonase (cycloisomerase 2 family)
LADAAGLPAGTTIVSFGTGTGGTGTYNMSAAALRNGADFVNVTNYDQHLYVGNSDGSVSVLDNAMPANSLTALEQDNDGIPGLSALAFYSYDSNSPSFLYVTGTDGIHIFQLSATGGSAGEVSGSPVAAGTTPSSITIFGNYLYVTNAGDGTVSGFVITPATGALTAIPGSPFQCGSNPSSITVNYRPEGSG